MLKYSLFAMLCTASLSAVLTVEFFISPELELRETRNSWHIAVAGEGCFAVLNDETLEINYTRSGILRLDDDNRLVLHVAKKEYQLEPPICIPTDSEDLRIDRDGYVNVIRGKDWQRIGSIQLTRFKNEMELSDPLGVNCLKHIPGNAIPAEPGTDGTGSILQGWTESRKVFSRHRVLGGAIIGLLMICSLVGSRAKDTNPRKINRTTH